MKKIRLLAIFVLFCYLLLPTKIHTQIDAQHGKNTFQYFQFSMIYWRVAILDDVESVTGIHVFEYFSNALNNDALSIEEREYYLQTLKALGGFISRERFNQEQVTKMLIDSVVNSDVERFRYLYVFFDAGNIKELHYRSELTGELFSLNALLEEKYGRKNNPFCKVKENRCTF